MRLRYLTACAGLVLLALVPSPAPAYIHFPPLSLPKLCQHSTAIRVLTVTKDLLAGKPVSVPVDKAVKALTIPKREKLVPALNEILGKNRGK